MKAELRLFLFVCLFLAAYGSRYQQCDSHDDCCRTQFCAHKKICYPKISCTYGCPDGECDPSINKCVPQPRCSSDYDCGIGNVCTMNYNLGYNTCQYNLDIGSTVCN